MNPLSETVRVRRLILLVVLLGLVTAACNRGDDESTETTVLATTAVIAETLATDAESAPTTATTESAGDSTVATPAAVVVGIPTYEVVGTADLGVETLIVIVEPGDFSNVELENLVFDIVDRFSPAAALVVDSKEAADLALLEVLTDEEEMELDQHTLISIENGVEVTFLGPYGDVPALTIGS